MALSQEGVKFSDFVKGLTAATESDLAAGNNMPIVTASSVKKIGGENVARKSVVDVKEEIFYKKEIESLSSLTKQKANIENYDIGDTWGGFSSASATRSVKLECSAGDIFVYKSFTGANFAMWAVLDSNNVILSKDKTGIGWRDENIVCPSNAAYVIVSFSDGKDWKFEKISNDRKEISNEIGLRIVCKEDVFYSSVIESLSSLTKQKANIENYDIGDTWGGFSSASSTKSVKIECSAGDVFAYKAFTGANFAMWAVLDSNNVILSKDKTGIGWRDENIVCPSNAAYVIVSFSGGYDWKFEKMSVGRAGVFNEARNIALIGDGVHNVVIGSSTEYGQGGDQGITEEQATKYGSVVNAGNVLQYLSKRNTDVYAYSGSDSMGILWNAGLAPLLLNKDVVLPKNKSSVSLTVTTDLKCPFGDWTTEYSLRGRNVTINGYKCWYDSGKLNLTGDYSHDVKLRKGSEIIVSQTAVKQANIVLCILGANAQGLSADTIVKMHEYVQKKIRCNYYFVLGSSRERESVSDAGKATDLLKSVFGDFYIDFFGYLCSRKALEDAGITPTTSAEYPDDNGQNSNPLSPEKIAIGFIPDMQCFSEQRLPSSFWSVNSTSGRADETHHNAIGYEIKGKYIYRYITEILGIKM